MEDWVHRDACAFSIAQMLADWRKRVQGPLEIGVPIDEAQRGTAFTGTNSYEPCETRVGLGLTNHQIPLKRWLDWIEQSRPYLQQSSNYFLYGCCVVGDQVGERS